MRTKLLLHDPGRLRDLIREYGRLTALEGHTEQSRGRKFNELISEVFNCWGMPAKANQRSSGEIDVVFELNMTRYILEAKWEKKKTNTTYIGKLQRRVRQRLSGTIGVFLSMSGYSEEALNEIKEGERLEIILFDKQHFEAMLSGAFCPDEIIGLALDKAHYDGVPFVPLASLIDLLSSDSSDLPQGELTGIESIFESSVDKFNAELILRDLQPIWGICELEEGQILVTHEDSIYSYDLNTKNVKKHFNVSDCHGSAVLDLDGSIIIARRHGVIRILHEEISFVAGGFPSPFSIHQKKDGIWIFSNSLGMPLIPNYKVEQPFACKIGCSLKNQSYQEIKLLSEGCACSALILENKLLGFDVQGLFIQDFLTKEKDLLLGQISLHSWHIEKSCGQAFLPISEKEYLVVHNNETGRIICTYLDLASVSTQELASFNLVTRCCLSVRKEGGGYLVGHYIENGSLKGAVLRVEYDFLLL